MHADQLVPAVIAAVAVVCLLIAGRADGLDEYVPAAVANQEVEPLATNQNPGQYLPQPEVMPVPTDLLARPVAAGSGGEEYVPQTDVVPEVMTHPGAALAGAFTGGYFPQQPTTEPEPETKAEPQPEQTTEPTPEKKAEPQPEQTTEPTPETKAEPQPEQTTKPEPEPVTPTREQGDFYRSGATPTTPEPPATPTSPETWETPATPSLPEQQSSSGGSYAGAGANKQVDDDGEPVNGLSPKAIANILKEHNVFRAKEHVPPLTWNATVAKYAQHYANERKGDCALKHSTGPYGENLMYGEGKAWTWRHTVDEWSDEKKNYHYGSNTCDAGKQCGHYTAVVWKGTTAVGCGRVTCTTGDTLMVCSYYPPGNYDGEKPY